MNKPLVHLHEFWFPTWSSAIRFSNWYFSIFQLLIYFGLFVCWKEFPSREQFLWGGLGVAIAMTVAMVWSKQQGYFQNRVDLSLHGLVVLDVVLESIAFEAVRLIWQVEETLPEAVLQFHDNTNFYGCTAIFAILIGGYRLTCLQSHKTPKSSEQSESDHTFNEENS